jgi:hypothetical protein
VRIKDLAGHDGVVLHAVADAEERGKGVGELEDAGGADEGGQVADLRDRSCDDPGENPVDWDQGDPEPFAEALV